MVPGRTESDEAMIVDVDEEEEAPSRDDVPTPDVQGVQSDETCTDLTSTDRALPCSRRMRRPSQLNAFQRQLLMHWKRICAIFVSEHKRMAARSRKRYYCLIIPTIVIPLIMTQVEAILHESEYPIMNSVRVLAYMGTATLSGVISAMKYDRRQVEYFHASSKYKEIILTIDDELTRLHGMRSNPSLLIQQIQTKLQFLGQTSPPLERQPLVEEEFDLMQLTTTRIAHVEAAVAERRRRGTFMKRLSLGRSKLGK